MGYHDTSIKITKAKLVSIYAGKDTDVKGPNGKSTSCSFLLQISWSWSQPGRVERSYVK